MPNSNQDNFTVHVDDLILITGATGFLGAKVLEMLLLGGFRRLRCLARASSDLRRVETISNQFPEARVEIARGNLVSADDCTAATRGVSLIYHLAAGRGEKSYADAFLNSVVSTRNLLQACLQEPGLRRFVNVSSFSVYSNLDNHRRMLDETCPVEYHPELRGEAYCFAKAKQDEIVTEYGKKFAIPYVIVRPGHVYGPGNEAISGRVGVGTFGLFMHLGGSNTIPFTYVDNCADAIVLAGLRKGIEGEILNVVDDDLPSSRSFLRMYKQSVGHFASLYVPHAVSYLLCYVWERYSRRSQGQLPPVFNVRKWHAFWKRTHYSNEKIKNVVGWTPRVDTAEGLRRYFEACRKMANA